MRIREFYIDNARYKAIDEFGDTIWVDIDYWSNSFCLSGPDKELESLAKDLLRRKHKVNFAGKLLK